MPPPVPLPPQIAVPGPLDNAVWHALHGPHQAFAERRSGAVRYRPDVTPFAALPDKPDDAAWADLAALVGSEGVAVLFRAPIDIPTTWHHEWRGTGVQMVAVEVKADPDPGAVRLDEDDAPEILQLIARTQPGPFLARTVTLGGYLGIRDDGRLIAMAGERFHLDGYTEISAVCTDSAYRQQGLGTRLVHAVAANIVGRGETPFLQAAVDNVNAIRLYESLGFAVRREVDIAVLRAPS